jgi:hypothetical protein
MKTVTLQKVANVSTPAVAAPRKSLRKDTAAAAAAKEAKNVKAADKFFGDLAAKGIGVAPKDVKAPVKASAKAKTATAIKSASKPAAKPAIKAETAPVATPFVARHYVMGTPIYSLDETTRPVAGRLLFAHTHAALTVLGLLDASRPAVGKSQVLTLMGQRAVSYHLKQGNIEDGPNRTIRLSVLGLNSFKRRIAENKIDTTAASAYQAAFLDGTPDKAIGITKANLYQAMFS